MHTTRRFFAFPVQCQLSATGRVSPYPFTASGFCYAETEQYFFYRFGSFQGQFHIISRLAGIIGMAFNQQIMIGICFQAVCQFPYRRVGISSEPAAVHLEHDIGSKQLERVELISAFTTGQPWFSAGPG